MYVFFIACLILKVCFVKWAICTAERRLPDFLFLSAIHLPPVLITIYTVQHVRICQAKSSFLFQAWCALIWQNCLKWAFLCWLFWCLTVLMFFVLSARLVLRLTLGKAFHLMPLFHSGILGDWVCDINLGRAPFVIVPSPGLLDWIPFRGLGWFWLVPGLSGHWVGSVLKFSAL